MPADFVEAMSVVIPRLLAHLDFSHYELLSQLSLYGTVYVTGKLQLILDKAFAKFLLEC